MNGVFFHFSETATWHLTALQHDPKLSSWPLSTKRTDVLPQYLVKSRSRKIGVQTFAIALQFDRHLGSSAAEMPVKFQSNTIIMTSNLCPLLETLLVCYHSNAQPSCPATQLNLDTLYFN